MDLTHILLGAGIQLIAKTASELGEIYLRDVLGWTEEEIAATIWYDQPAGPNLPQTDEWVLDLGIPGSLMVGSLVMKNEKLKGMAVGSGLTGLGCFISDVLSKAGGWIPPPAAQVAVALPRGRLAPKMIPGVLMPKFQYGNGNPIALGTKARLAGGMYPAGQVPTRPGETARVGARQAITVGPYAGGIVAPKFTPGVLRPKYQHGA